MGAGIAAVADGSPGVASHLSSAVVTSPVPPVPRVGLSFPVGDGMVDLSTRVLVAGVVPLPRFGREAEAAATAASVTAQGADLVDVSLPARLIGSVAASVPVPVVARVGSVEDALAAAQAGAAAVLALAPLLADLCGHPDLVKLGTVPVLVLDDLAGLSEASAMAAGLRVPLAFDSTRLPAAPAIGCESAAVAEGCRLVRTADIRRSRRVAEVMAAILGARRGTGAPDHGEEPT